MNILALTLIAFISLLVFFFFFSDISKVFPVFKVRVRNRAETEKRVLKFSPCTPRGSVHAPHLCKLAFCARSADAPLWPPPSKILGFVFSSISLPNNSIGQYKVFLSFQNATLQLTVVTVQGGNCPSWLFFQIGIVPMGLGRVTIVQVHSIFSVKNVCS